MERALSLTALMKRIGRTLVPITVLGLGIVMALPQSAYAAICPANDSKFANCSSCNITPGTGTVDEFGNAIPPQYYCSVTNSDGSRTDVVGGSDIGNSSTTRDPNGQITEQSHTPGTNALIAEPLGNGILATVLSPIAVVSFLILSLASFLLWLAGVLFNWAVAYLVFDFGTWFGNSPGLLLAWRILRDFGNIILLYGFVYMGIATILDLHDYTVKKALPNLVIFAVLLNFSLFISQLVIDTSNVFASTLYNQTYSEACDSGTREECLQNTGIASQIVQQAGIGSVFGNTQQNGFVRAANLMGDYVSNPIATTISFFGLALLVTTAAVVLFAGALLLIARAIHLGFLMVTSPIGFAGMAVPPLQKIASDWWGQLINQALFAPVFLLLLFAALKITEGLQALKNDTRGNLGDAIANGGAGDTGAIMLFALVIGFMIAALLMAKRFGVYGADAITKNALGVIQGTAGAASFGAMGSAGRFLIGRPANLASRMWRRSTMSAIPIVGGVVAGALDKGATTSFDGRSMFGLKDLGEVGKDEKKGRRGVKDARAKAHEHHEHSREEADEEEYKKYDLIVGPLKDEKKTLEAQIKAELALNDGAPTVRSRELEAKLAHVEEQLNTPAARNAQEKMDATLKGQKERKKEVSAEYTKEAAEATKAKADSDRAARELARLEQERVQEQAAHNARVTALDAERQRMLDEGNVVAAAELQGNIDAANAAKVARDEARILRRERLEIDKAGYDAEVVRRRENATRTGRRLDRMEENIEREENRYLRNLQAAANIPIFDGGALRAAGVKIRKAQKESPRDKLLKQLQDAMKKTDDHSGDGGNAGGGAAPAPAGRPAPAAGGGGGADHH